MSLRSSHKKHVHREFQPVNAMRLMGAVGVGIAAGAGTGIVTGVVSSAII